MEETARVAVAQIDCSVSDVAANIEKMRLFSARAAAERAALIVFPEMSDTGYSMPAIATHAAPWDEGFLPAMQETARAHAMYVVAGLSERIGGRIYNAQAVVAPDGVLLGRYRKTHLFSPAPVEEHRCFACGDEIVSTQAGRWRLGLSICYDLRFPELYRCLAVDQQVDLFAVSSAWPFPRSEHLRILAQARAIENQSCLLLANRVGNDDGATFCGGSAVIGPRGELIAMAPADAEALLVGTISHDDVQTVRRAMPVFDHRRPGVYLPAQS